MKNPPTEYDRNYSQVGTLASQARGLSSGTIGTLTGLRAYADIDKVQAAFVEFCIEHEEQYITWVDAWNKFYKPD